MKKNRRELLGLAAALSALPLKGAASNPLGSVVIDARNARVQKESFGELRYFFEGKTDQLKSMTAGSLRLNPGAEPHPPHQHPEEEFMVVTEGSGELLVDGKKSKVGPGSMMYCGGGKLHGIKNTGSTPLLFYFYKWQG